MGSSANERIALEIQTTADLSGSRAVRDDVKTLASETKAATAEMVASDQKLTLSEEQLARIRKEAAGDYQKLLTLLKDAVRQQETLSSATANATSQLKAQAGVAGERQLGPFPAGPSQLGPALPNTPTGGSNYANRFVGLAELSAYRMEAERAAVSINKVPGSARTAANAIGMLSQAAISGGGSMAGMATAAGGIAVGISAMSNSARVAASAAGIGALITVAAVAFEALSRMNDRLNTSKAVLDHIGNFGTKNLSGARVELELVERKISDLQAKAASAAGRDLLGGNLVPGTDANRAQKELDVALALRNTLSDKIREVDKQDVIESRNRTLAAIAIEVQARTTATGRYSAELANIEAQRKEAIRSRELTEEAANRRAFGQRRELERQSQEYVLSLADATAAARDAIVAGPFQSRINAANREAENEKRAITERKLSLEDEKAALDYIELKRRGIVALAERDRTLANESARTAIGLGSDNPLTQQNARLQQIEEEKQAQIRAGIDVGIAQEAAEQKKRKLFRDTMATTAASLKSIVDLTANSDNARTKSLHEFAKNYRAIIIGAKAAEAAVDSAKAFASVPAHLAVGDFTGAALAALAGTQLAAAAILGFAEAGGVGSRGGGSAGGGGGEGSTFRPTGDGGGGPQTINLYTVNPTTKEIVGQISYELHRSGVLKRPIFLPPTTGLLGAA